VRDLKTAKPAKVKSNRRKRERQPRDWKGLFRRLLRLSVGVGSVALAAGGAFLAVQLLREADFFRIDRIRVLNQQRVGQEEILALSNVRCGQNIFDLDLELIGRKIAENPWIASARVERVFPREVVIRVVERSPKAVINLGYLYYVDGSGEIFKLLEASDSLDYPVLTGIDRRALLDNPAEVKQQLAEAMVLIDELGGRRIFALDDVSEIRIDPTDGLVLYTYASGVPVRMGYGNFGSKLDRLERIYRELEPRLPALSYIDLNVADRVIVKVDTSRVTGKAAKDSKIRLQG
jgi:cell division protein FtsQ